MIIPPGAFFIFFDILIFQAVSGWKGKKWIKMKNKSYAQHTTYLRNSKAYDHDFWYTFVKWWYLQVFFSFFFFLYFLFKKWPKMTKKMCLLQLISQKPYIIWLSFIVPLCKMIISPGAFFNFSKFWFTDY